MQSNNLIEEKLFGYENFLKYCKESGKKFIDELDREDFIAYRSEYSASREQIEQIKKLLGVHEKKSIEAIFLSQDISDNSSVSEDSLGNLFHIDEFSPYEKVLISELDFNLRVQHCLKADNYKTLAELLKSSQKNLSRLKNFGKGSFDNLMLTLKKFFESQGKKISNKTLKPVGEEFLERDIDFDIDKLKNFVNAPDFDVQTFAKKFCASLFKNEREFNIICRRAGGDTLAEIGKNFCVTRERVRQIELKSIDRFKKNYVYAKKILYFLHAMTDGKSFLTLDDAKIFLNESDAEILWFFVAKTNFSSNVFHFDKGLNAFIFADKLVIDENKLRENFPDVMEEKFFEETIINFANEKNYPVELVKTKLSKIYRRKGKIFYRGRLTLTFEFALILKERFPNGYKIADENSYKRFIRYIQEIFDEKTPLTQRNVDAKIGTIGFLCDRGKYIHPDFVHIPPEIIERVKNFIDRSDHTAIFYKEIFETLKEFFVGTQITNHYFLQGAIKFYNLPYTLRKDYLTKADEIDMGKEFDSFVAERGEVSPQEVKENFISFKDFNIAFLVERCPEVIRVGDGFLLHSTHLNLQKKDFEPIENFLRQNCSTSANTRVLFDLFFERFADFMTRNEIQSHNKLFGVLQYMFRDEFNFSRPYISTSNIKDITNKKVLLHLLESMEEIAIEDLIGICKENGINFVTRNHLIKSLRPDFIRVDEFTLRRPESIGITDEIISIVIENIFAAIERNGGWQAAQTFEDYEWLPQLETSWNSFLLESVVSLADNAPHSLKIPSTSSNFSSTIFLSEKFVEDDFQSFLTKILIDEHNKEPFRSEKEIFDWLRKNGLCNKKLPKFLADGRAFEILNESD